MDERVIFFCKRKGIFMGGSLVFVDGVWLLEAGR